MLDLIIDFDNTIADSSKRVYDMFLKHHNLPENSPFDYSKLKWGFEPYVTSEEDKRECLSYFDDEDFYSELTWIDEYAKDAIKCLHNKEYNIIICSKRNKNAYAPLLDWLDQNMPCEYQTCFVSTFDKGMVGRRNSIIIDDKPTCLIGNLDRSKKILFGNYGYQQDEFDKLNTPIECDELKNIIRCASWLDVLNVLS